MTGEYIQAFGLKQGLVACFVLEDKPLHERCGKNDLPDEPQPAIGLDGQRQAGGADT